MTNHQLSEAVHIFYNCSTNVLCSVKYRRDLETYEVLRSDVTYIQLMSMDLIIERRGTEKWEFIGVI